MGRLPEDHFSTSILLSDKSTHGSVQENLGIAYWSLGHVEKVQYYEKALAIGKEIKDLKGREYGMFWCVSCKKPS